MIHKIQHALAGLVALALAVAATPHADAQITLDASFDHASLQSYSISGTGGRGGSTINLVGRDNFYTGTWLWVYFRADGVLNESPQFSLGTNYAGFDVRDLDTHTMMWSYDNENWQPFEQHNRTASNYTFRNNDAYDQDSIYVAYSIPYSYGRAADMIDRIKPSPWVQPTQSADSDLVIGQSPGGIDDLGRVQTPKDVWGFRVTDPNATGPKKKIAMISGVHAGETLGSLHMEGVINWLVSDDPRADALRQAAEFYIYPMMNPDGRHAGSNRATLANPNSDPNGDWNPAQFNLHPDNKIIGEALINDTAADVDYFIDFHSTVQGPLQTDFAFLEFGKNNQNDPFWLAYRELEPQVEQIDSTSNGWISANFADWELDAEFDMTFETMFLPNPTEAYYLDLGANIGVAFYEAFDLAPQGDFNNDGEVDADDIDLLLANLGDPAYDLTGNGVANAADVTAMIEDILATAFGDANLDRAINTSDLAILAANFNQPTTSWAQADFNGDGIVNTADLAVLAANFDNGAPLTAAAVPEPATLALAALASLATLLRRRHTA
ncbi:MAG: M14 family zinc carboxypeptidase [Planctomycetota bacterium]